MNRIRTTRRPLTRVARAAVVALAGTVGLTLAAAPGSTSAADPGSDPATAGAVPRPTAAPGLRVRKVVTGLSQPWDVKAIGTDDWLITERDSKRLLRWHDGRLDAVQFPSDTVWSEFETGLMGLAVDPAFRGNRRFYTCQGSYRKDGGHDIEVRAWRLSAGGARAIPAGVLLRGIPTVTGQHGGCRLLPIVGSQMMYVGTGDAALSRTPQSLTSLGGKTLRLNRSNGKPWPTNPFADADSVHKRYVFTYGHRNVQGLARRNDGRIWSVEHGPDHDDEVNLLRAGGNYGWDPGPGYDQSVPMTDFSLPGPQIGAKWHSGDTTFATSGASFVYGKQWGAYDGTLAVAALRTSRVFFMRFSAAGDLQWTRTPPALTKYGRLRSVTRLAGGDLLITTANGSDDAVLRVSPRT